MPSGVLFTDCVVADASRNDGLAKSWIASSLILLAMTGEADASRNDGRDHDHGTGKNWIAASLMLLAMTGWERAGLLRR